MEELNQKIKNRKITEKKDIKNKHNTPKDYNTQSEFAKDNQINNDNECYNIDGDCSFENYCNNTTTLQFNNVKKYNSLIRILNGEYLNKWRPLYRRLLISSQINKEINPELSLRLKNDAIWLKNNSKHLVLMNNTNMHDKASPSLKNLKNYKVCMSPTYTNNLFNIITSENKELLK